LLLRDSLNEIYEYLILNNDSDFHPLEDLIDSLVTSISSAESHNEANITLEPTSLFYLFKFSRAYKVGGISSP